MISFTVLILDLGDNYLPRKSSFVQLHYDQTFQVLREFLCPERKRESIGEQNICVGGVSGGTYLHTVLSKRQKGTPQSSSKCWVMSRAPLILSIFLSSKCKLRKKPFSFSLLGEFPLSTPKRTLYLPFQLSKLSSHHCHLYCVPMFLV